MKKKIVLSVLGVAFMTALFFVISLKNKDKASLLYDNTEAYTNYDFFEDIVRNFKVYQSHTVYKTESHTNAPSASFYAGVLAAVWSFIEAGTITITGGLGAGIPMLMGLAEGTETEVLRCCGNEGGWCCPYDGYHTNAQHCINEVFDYRNNPYGL